ncbi:MAG: hypothetical protein DMG13_31905 [Acidobacteria bacterium]|nr:MAG: hypothetical protein DMG13_31905 [Acidobacteriota bacterium]
MTTVPLSTRMQCKETHSYHRFISKTLDFLVNRFDKFLRPYCFDVLGIAVKRSRAELFSELC